MVAATQWDHEDRPLSVIVQIDPDDSSDDEDDDGCPAYSCNVSPSKTGYANSKGASTDGRSLLSTDEESIMGEVEPLSPADSALMSDAPLPADTGHSCQTPPGYNNQGNDGDVPEHELSLQEWFSELPQVAFEVEIERHGAQELGLDVIQQGDAILYVKGIKPGIVQQHGETFPERRIIAGDRITAVNGMEGSPSNLVSMVKASTGCPRLQLTVRRVVEFAITVEQEGKLGIDVGFTSVSMKILALVPGASIEAWNTTADEQLQVRPGDHIIEVNGFRGKCEQLLKEMRQAGRPLHLVLARGDGCRPDHHEVKDRPTAPPALAAELRPQNSCASKGAGNKNHQRPQDYRPQR